MKRFKNILIATDKRFDNHPIVAEAVDLALHNESSLKILGCVPEFSWTVRQGLPEHEHLRELMAAENREKLAALAESITAQGLAVETKVLMGKASVELIRGNHDLVMRVPKGKTSRRTSYFGRTGQLLLRKCPCAVWLVASETTPNFKNVVACVDTSSDSTVDAQHNDQLYELASLLSHYHDGRFSIVHAWSIYGEQVLHGRISAAEFARMKLESRDAVARLFDSFLNKHGCSIRAENVHLIDGEPSAVIPSFVRESGADLLIMGTIARSGIAGLLLGNTAEQILSRTECSVLALKPSSFRTTIQMDLN